MNTVNENIITNELINNFKIYLYEEERSENTIEKYMRDIRFFREWLQDRCVDKSVVIEYKKELCKRYAVKSVNSILSSLNAFFVFMGWYDLKVKTLKIQRRIFADKSKELSKAEYERLLAAAKDKKLGKAFQAAVSVPDDPVFHFEHESLPPEELFPKD